MRPNNRDVQRTARQLRQQMGKGEAAVWAVIRANKLGFKFRRQLVVNRYILDFGSITLKLGIEVDGNIFHERWDKFDADEQRTKELNELGWSILRIGDSKVRYSSTWFPQFLHLIIGHLQYGYELPQAAAKHISSVEAPFPRSSNGTVTPNPTRHSDERANHFGSSPALSQ